MNNAEIENSLIIEEMYSSHYYCILNKLIRQKLIYLKRSCYSFPSLPVFFLFDLGPFGSGLFSIAVFDYLSIRVSS